MSDRRHLHDVSEPRLSEFLKGLLMDGSRVTPGTDKCQCDKDGRTCEMPCWQRIGLTSRPCCPGCPPLPDSDES